MNTHQTISKSPVTNKQETQSRDKSRDSAGFTWSTMIKITDPKSGQILLHTRGE